MSQNLENSENLVEEKPITEPAISWETPREPLKSWRFWVPLVLQTILIAAVPAQSAYTFVTGKTVVLQTMPVDPYDLLRGYSQTLSYDISQQNTLKNLPGWNDLPGTMSSCPPAPKPPAKNTCKPEKYVESGISLYVILEQPKTQKSSGLPLAWKPVRVTDKLPQNLPANQIAIRGKYQGWQTEYGLESYYMPEDQRNDINDDINRATSQGGQNRQKQPFVVEVKVDKQGNAVPVSLWVKDRNYRF